LTLLLGLTALDINGEAALAGIQAVA